MENTKIISLNTNGLRLAPKRRALFKKFASSNADFIFLQEIHSVPADEKIWTSEWGGTAIFSHGKSNSCGVCILFKRGSNPSISHTVKDPHGRFIIIQVDTDNEPLTLINVYSPTQSEPREQTDFIASLQEGMTNLEIQTTILGGDFNIQLDKQPQPSRQQRVASVSYYSQLLTLLDEYHLVDTWKIIHPNSKRGTFHRKNYSARLDYIFASDFLISTSTTVNIAPEPLSDHSTIGIHFKMPTTNRGPGFWRMNNLLLNDPEFVAEMRQNILDSLEEELQDPNMRWEWIKFKIRSFAISYGINKTRQEKKHINSLEKRLKFLAEVFDLTASPDIVSEVESLKRELAEGLQHQANKTIFKTKANWTQWGEKPSAYFLGLEKRRGKSKTITTLQDEEGHLLMNNTDILEYEKRYFTKIYTEIPDDLSSLEDLPLQKEDVPQVSDSHRAIANLPFSPRDFHLALKQLNKNKSPGSDGLTPELCLAFWDILQDTFFQSISYSLENEKLTQEQRVGIITLVPKKAQDRTKLANWRPITLLNTDFKIFSKALANKIQPCIKDVIAEDQTGFIKGRTIATNLMNIQAVINQVNISDSNALLLSVDYAKAFDTIRWSLIDKALDIFGFGETITLAVKTLFTDINSCVYNSGFSSGYFSPTRGIRQGCCCSPSLFIIAVELLAILVRKSEDITGIYMTDQQLKISLYADDATFFIKDLSSLEKLLRLLSFFSNFSGLKINSSKSYILLLGNHLHPPTQIQDIQVVQQVTILGITVANNLTDDQQYQWNFQEKLTRIKGICNTWWNRNLSLKGKVVLINSLLISILQYPCTCTATPTRVYVEFKAIVTDFLWNHGRNKVAYNLMIQDIQEGGLRLADLETRIRVIHINWLKFMWNNPQSTISRWVQKNLGIEHIGTIILSNLDHTATFDHRQTFIKQIFNTWAKLHISQPTIELEVQEELLWYNKYILVGMETVFWKKWYEAGIVHINDILHETEPRFLTHVELHNKFGVPASFLQILQLRTAIPVIWKRKIVSSRAQELVVSPTFKKHDSTPLNILKHTSKQLYYDIIRHKKPAVSSQSKWNENFSVTIETQNEYWAEIYKRPYMSGRDTKLQSFQFRICHRIIPCNKFLRNIRIRPDDNCSFCQEQDSIQHFLFLCPDTKAFWNTLCNWFATEVDIQIDMSSRSFLFGISVDRPQDKMVNFLLLLVKFYIYRQKLFHQGKFCLLQFLRELRSRLQVEKYILKLENKSSRFAPWNKVYMALG